MNNSSNSTSAVKNSAVKNSAVKTSESRFLAANPYPRPLTEGLFYREKMRAIYRIAPQGPLRDILEVGGGRSGMAALLYPGARITTLDMDPSHADAPCNRLENVRFVQGDARALPFADESFDAVTMFDLLEHVEEHEKAASEARRVLRPGGFLMVSSPNETWRYPWYSALKPVCPPEEELFERWGHVRRGYTEEELRNVVGLPLESSATFINPLTAACHDISFSRLPLPLRYLVWAALAPVTAVGYSTHRPDSPGTETATLWQKPVAGTGAAA
jgi:SAM-dependent methyltransferase